MKYAADAGLPLEKDNRYQGTDGSNTCLGNAPIFFKIKGVEVSRNGDQNGLENLVERGPVVIAIDANAWHTYTGGILRNCPASQPNHAVTLVGYTADYYLVKNSWGAGWGEQGYIKLARGRGLNSCNIFYQGVLPVGFGKANPNPNPGPGPEPEPDNDEDPNCKDNNSACSYWAGRGECSTRQGAYEICPKSCGKCKSNPSPNPSPQPDCQDLNQNCPGWAHLCNDGYYGQYMAENCPATCRRCGNGPSPAPRPVCQDKDQNCRGWGAYYCNDPQYGQWMAENCAQTCRRC